ncbi:UPF0755 protein [Catalinimonas alkaloidigena]|uniref:Endolytic murein transglycosylase n=1 Tax=Catalinimonas alkaloidigena TaxID=1075417 RepID=A0A1G9ALU8_9BACT|nr:endolytic transglycosylase MltG [Catalinimonas alkaloidigena]SDK27784.1 UPF0755 protein [Catalinimonas alkaloidigena]
MRRPFRILFVTLITVSVVAVTFSFYGYQMLFTPNVLVEKPDHLLYIPTGATYATVIDSLEKYDMVQDPVSFSFLARLSGYQDNVKPGVYQLRKDMTNKEALWLLRSGAQVPVNLTFNNVRVKQDLADRLAQYVEAPSEQILGMLRDTAIARQYGFDTLNFVSMFIPNTYEVYWTTSPQALFDRMHKEYEAFWNTEQNGTTRRDKAQALDLTPQQVTVLASIVEAETKKPDEMPRVAGVYLNRLQRGWALQADPTIVFASGDFALKRVLNVHKEIDSPYNTYMYPGLPPGPINLPSIRAIDAVLNSEEHKYMYFCAREDFSGYHNFAQTLTEHNRNALIYQRALNAAGIR